MTYGELLKQLEAYMIVYPHYENQQVFDIKIDPSGTIKISLEQALISISIT